MAHLGCVLARKNTTLEALNLSMKSPIFPSSLEAPDGPASQSHLNYAFLPGTRVDAMSPVANAFQTWAANTHFRDGSPFDGPGGTFAHAFAPTDGRFHYDADETWSVSVSPGAFHLETVALHEIGHLLGLGHSSVENAIMYPSISSGMSKGLGQDDVQGIRVLYNR
ncbi:hypothetical protein CRYUN_Cryun15aG0026200 [Craigia yunnanensis]